MEYPMIYEWMSARIVVIIYSLASERKEQDLIYIGITLMSKCVRKAFVVSKIEQTLAAKYGSYNFTLLRIRK